MAAVRRSNVRLDRFLGDGLFAAAAARLLSELTEFRTRSRTLSSQQNLLPSPACSTRSRVLAELPAEGQIQESERCAVNSWPPGAGCWKAGSSVSGVPGVSGVSGRIKKPNHQVERSEQVPSHSVMTGDSVLGQGGEMCSVADARHDTPTGDAASLPPRATA